MDQIKCLVYLNLQGSQGNSLSNVWLIQFLQDEKITNYTIPATADNPEYICQENQQSNSIYKRNNKHRVINTVYLNMWYLLNSQVHSVSLL